MTWVTSNWAMIMTVLFGLDQVLAAIPSVQANSVFQLFANIITALHTAVGTTATTPAATAATTTTTPAA